MKAIINKRQNELNKLGLKFNGISFVYKDINFHWSDLMCMSDEQFYKELKLAKKRMIAIKKEEKNESNNDTE